MLAVSSLTSVVNEREFSMEDEGEFEEFTGGNLLDSIDFDDIFVGIQVLPDLETYQDFLADYQHDENTSSPAPESVSVSGSGSGSGSEVGFGSEEESGKSRKSSKKPPGGKKKKKPKVDWTAELHRRFVQAVEQLGLEKAVPSRILEIMGVHTLTRHNIASHLQKYRSHRKHLVAREAEAAHWSQRQQQVKPWIAPTMAFPPPPMPHLIRPLHVWGHPSVDQSMMAIWPKHVAPWQPPPPPFWHPHHQYVPTTGTPCFPPQLPPMRAAMYKVEPGAAPQTVLTKAPSDVHPTKESIDAAIGEVIAKPWLPLPLGLKPPSMESVMTQLQRQGVSNIPQS